MDKVYNVLLDNQITDLHEKLNHNTKVSSRDGGNKKQN